MKLIDGRVRFNIGTLVDGEAMPIVPGGPPPVGVVERVDYVRPLPGTVVAVARWRQLTAEERDLWARDRAGYAKAKA